MRCPNCGVKISSLSNFCNYCGVALKPKQTRRSFKMIILLGVVLVCLGIFYMIRHFSAAPSDDFFGTGLKDLSSGSQKKQDAAQLQTEKSKTRSQTKINRLTIGLVTIKDISGAVLSQIPAPVVSRGWIALPVRICYGGYNWSFSIEAERQIEIEWGRLHDRDEVGLWWIKGAKDLSGPDLAPWSEHETLNWVSILSNRNLEPVTIREYDEQGYFAKIAMPGKLSEPGIFVQGDKVVGWSFGQMAAGGYLWMGRKGSALTYDFRVEDFYRLTFGNSREEEFVLALSRKDCTDSGLLAALAEAFLLESKLPPQSIPAHLRREPIIGKMRSMLAKLISEGNHRVVSEIFDSQILINAQDPLLLADAAYAIMKSDGYENAIWLLDEVRENVLFEKEAEKSRLDELHLRLYQGWLRELMEDGNITSATLALDAANSLFPEDPVIHLLGVRLALEKSDWEEAQRLLFLRRYPVSLQDTVKNLENRISKLKSLERKIVIRFSPGSKYIPVHADLNHTIRQKFIIDTGATLSTIPSRTAKKLGINIDYSNPIRIIYTAGGAKKAPEVVLSSIEIGQWAIYDFKTLVLDLPYQPDAGLLGLNYLNQFHMNLNADEGILTLEPR